MNKHLTSLLMAMAMTLTLLAACNGRNKSQTVDNDARTQIINELKETQSQLPMKVGGTDFTVTEMKIDGDLFIYTLTLPRKLWQEQGLSAEAANSDKNIARILLNFDESIINKLIAAHLGFKYIYKEEETGDTLTTMTLSCEKMERVLNGLNNGTIKPFTMMEIADMEIAHMQLPAQIDDGIWLTEVKTAGGNIYYTAEMEEELEAKDMGADMLADIKANIIDGLKAERTFLQNKQLIISGNTHFIYIYKDNRGHEVARIDVSPEDLFD